MSLPDQPACGARSPGAAFAIGAFGLLVVAAWRCATSDLHGLALSVQDDSFYYLLPAFHLHTHGTWTLDGQHPTYGFQPLYAVLLAVLAPAFDDRGVYLRAMVWVSFALQTAAAAVLAVAVRQLAKRFAPATAAAAGWAAAALFLFQSPTLGAATTLKENALYALVLASSLVAWLRARAEPSRGRLLVLGFAVGLCLLTRIVSSTFAIAAVQLATCRWRQVRGGLPLLALGIALSTAPWLLYAQATFGRVLPTPGAVKTAWLATAWRDGVLMEHLAASLGTVPGYAADVVRTSLGFGSRFYVPAGQPAGSGLDAAAWLLLAMLAALVASLGRRANAMRASADARWLAVLVVVGLVATATNPLMLDAGAGSPLLLYSRWYVAAEPLLLPAVAAFALPVFLVHRPRLLAVGIVLLAALAAVDFAPLPAPRPDPRDMTSQALAMAVRANEKLAPEARIAAGNAGVVAFIAERPVTNLDGLANDDIVAARQSGVSTHAYLRARGIDHILDMLPPRGAWCGSNPFDRLDLLDALPLHAPGHEGYYLFRVTDTRFPDFTPPGSVEGIALHPWQQPSPVARTPWSWRNWHFDARKAPRRLEFSTGGRFAELRATAIGDGAELCCRGDGQELHRTIVGPKAQEVRVGIGGVQCVAVELRGGSAWLADVAFPEHSELPGPAPSEGPYGTGFAPAGGAPPELTATRTALGIHFTLAPAVAGATSEVLVSLQGDDRVLGEGQRLFVALPPIASVRLGPDGGDWDPPPAARGRWIHAQAVCSANGKYVAASAGLRLLLAP